MRVSVLIFLIMALIPVATFSANSKDADPGAYTRVPELCKRNLFAPRDVDKSNKYSEELPGWIRLNGETVDRLEHEVQEELVTTFKVIDGKKEDVSVREHFKDKQGCSMAIGFQIDGSSPYIRLWVEKRTYDGVFDDEASWHFMRGIGNAYSARYFPELSDECSKEAAFCQRGLTPYKDKKESKLNISEEDVSYIKKSFLPLEAKEWKANGVKLAFRDRSFSFEPSCKKLAHCKDVGSLDGFGKLYGRLRGDLIFRYPEGIEYYFRPEYEKSLESNNNLEMPLGQAKSLKKSGQYSCNSEGPAGPEISWVFDDFYEKHVNDLEDPGGPFLGGRVYKVKFKSGLFNLLYSEYLKKFSEEETTATAISREEFYQIVPVVFFQDAFGRFIRCQDNTMPSRGI